MNVIETMMSFATIQTQSNHFEPECYSGKMTVVNRVLSFILPNSRKFSIQTFKIAIVCGYFRVPICFGFKNSPKINDLSASEYLTRFKAGPKIR